MAKPKSTPLKGKTTTNQVVGLDGNQLLEAINKDNDETPMKLHVSSAIHEKAQDQVNWSSQHLCEKAVSNSKSKTELQMTCMEDIVGGHSLPPT